MVRVVGEGILMCWTRIFWVNQNNSPVILYVQLESTVDSVAVTLPHLLIDQMRKVAETVADSFADFLLHFFTILVAQEHSLISSQ